MTYSKFYFEEFILTENNLTNIRIRNRLSLIKDRNSIRVFQDGAVLRGGGGATDGLRLDFAY